MTNSFIKDLISVVFSKFGIILFGLSTSIIIARTLGPDKNGIIATLLVYPSLFMSIGSLGIRQSVTFFLGKKTFNENQIKTAITQIWVLTSLISIIICFYVMVYFSKSGDNLVLVGLALIPIPFTLFNTYNSGIFLGKNQIILFNRITWIPPLIILICTLVFVLLFSLDIEGFLIAMIGGPLFIFIILLLKNKFIQAFSLIFDWNIIKQLLTLGLVYAFALLVVSLNYKLDIILLDYFSIPFETGIYYRGAGFAEYLWQIPMLLSTIVFARGVVAKNDKHFSLKVTQLLRLSLIAMIIGILFIFFLSESIIINMYGEEFRGSIQVLNILLPGVFLLTFFKVINMDLAAKGKPWVSLKAMIPALVINVLLNIIWIPVHGANGAAFASTISYSIAGVLFLYFYSKEVQIPISIILKFKKTDFNPVIQILRKLKH